MDHVPQWYGQVYTCFTIFTVNVAIVPVLLIINTILGENVHVPSPHGDNVDVTSPHVDVPSRVQFIYNKLGMYYYDMLQLEGEY